MGSSLDRVKPKTIKLVFTATSVSVQLQGVRGKNGWFGIMIMCPSEATCLPGNFCVSELTL